MQLYVVRHGQTDYNVKRIFQGRTDIPLNETGLEQARQTAQYFKDVKIDNIIVSPLTRTKQTASYIIDITKVQPIYDERLIERCFGDYEGTENKGEPKLKLFLDYEMNLSDENVESIQDLFKRVYSYLDELKEKYHDKSVVLVTHGAVSIPIECYFKGLPTPANYDTLEPLVLKNCEVRKYEI